MLAGRWPHSGKSVLSELRRSVVHLFPPLYLAPVVLWPSYQGMRFLIPLVPFYFCYCLLGVRRIDTAAAAPVGGEERGPGGVSCCRAGLVCQSLLDAAAWSDSRRDCENGEPGTLRVHEIQPLIRTMSLYSASRALWRS